MSFIAGLLDGLFPPAHVEPALPALPVLPVLPPVPPGADADESDSDDDEDAVAATPRASPQRGGPVASPAMPIVVPVPFALLPQGDADEFGSDDDEEPALPPLPLPALPLLPLPPAQEGAELDVDAALQDDSDADGSPLQRPLNFGGLRRRLFGGDDNAGEAAPPERQPESVAVSRRRRLRHDRLRRRHHRAEQEEERDDVESIGDGKKGLVTHAQLRAMMEQDAHYSETVAHRVLATDQEVEDARAWPYAEWTPTQPRDAVADLINGVRSAYVMPTTVQQVADGIRQALHNGSKFLWRYFEFIHLNNVPALPESLPDKDITPANLETFLRPGNKNHLGWTKQKLKQAIIKSGVDPNIVPGLVPTGGAFLVGMRAPTRVDSIYRTVEEEEAARASATLDMSQYNAGKSWPRKQFYVDVLRAIYAYSALAEPPARPRPRPRRPCGDPTADNYMEGTPPGTEDCVYTPLMCRNNRSPWSQQEFNRRTKHKKNDLVILDGVCSDRDGLIEVLTNNIDEPLHNSESMEVTGQTEFTINGMVVDASLYDTAVMLQTFQRDPESYQDHPLLSLDINALSEDAWINGLRQMEHQAPEDEFHGLVEMGILVVTDTAFMDGTDVSLYGPDWDKVTNANLKTRYNTSDNSFIPYLPEKRQKEYVKIPGDAVRLVTLENARKLRRLISDTGSRVFYTADTGRRINIGRPHVFSGAFLPNTRLYEVRFDAPGQLLYEERELHWEQRQAAAQEERKRNAAAGSDDEEAKDDEDEDEDEEEPRVGNVALGDLVRAMNALLGPPAGLDGATKRRLMAARGRVSQNMAVLQLDADELATLVGEVNRGDMHNAGRLAQLLLERYP
jgi:hypothetical protein